MQKESSIGFNRRGKLEKLRQKLIIKLSLLRNILEERLRGSSINIEIINHLRKLSLLIYKIEKGIMIYDTDYKDTYFKFSILEVIGI